MQTKSKMQLKTVHLNFLAFFSVFALLFAIFISLSARIYRKNAQQMYESVMSNSLLLEEAYADQLKYNLNLYSSNVTELLENKCNYGTHRGPRILCAVFCTRPDTNSLLSAIFQVKAVHNTWAKRYAIYEKKKKL